MGRRMSQLESLADELSGIIDQVKAIESRFQRTRDSISISIEDQTTFRALVTDVISIYALGFGPNSQFARDLVNWVNEYSGGMSGGPSLYAVQGAHKLMDTALRQMRRIQVSTSTAPVQSSQPNRSPYVSPSRLNELRALPNGKWDFTRLIRMVEELNDAHERGNFVTVPMLVRAIKDHVPPIFSSPNFAGVFNNSSKSLKGNLERLENSLKHIADGQLHSHIRSSEVLPTDVQVDFRNDLDVLLGEVVRMVKA